MDEDGGNDEGKGRGAAGGGMLLRLVSESDRLARRVVRPILFRVSVRS